MSIFLKEGHQTERSRYLVRTILEFLCVGLLAGLLGGFNYKFRGGVSRPAWVLWEEVSKRDVLFVDVRPTREFAKGHLSGAISVPAERIFAHNFPAELQSVDFVVYADPATPDLAALISTELAQHYHRHPQILRDPPLVP